MSKILATVGALALAATLALPAAGNAAGRKADGLYGGGATGMTDVSANGRRHVAVRRGWRVPVAYRPPAPLYYAANGLYGPWYNPYFGTYPIYATRLASDGFGPPLPGVPILLAPTQPGQYR